MGWGGVERMQMKLANSRKEAESRVMQLQTVEDQRGGTMQRLIAAAMVCGGAEGGSVEWSQ
eukprot:746654-Hanusia_phi.AAC.7